jgi:predicted DNA-binding protein (UPF0251 family)
MARPRQSRKVNYSPRVTYFRPDGVGFKASNDVVLAKDEIEALRLVDFRKEPQTSAARSMKISQPTLSRTLETARRKVSEALVTGKAIKIEGGNSIISSTSLLDRAKERFFE